MDKNTSTKDIRKIVIDDSEDVEIRDIAYQKVSYYKKLLLVLTILFIVMLISSFIMVTKLYQNKQNNTEVETIEIKNNVDNILITNIAGIKETITNNSFKENKDLVVEKVNTIDITSIEDSTRDSKILIDIRYEILENDFRRNEFAQNDSDVLVRFSYSYDKVNWTYINNVISADDTTITPMMGNYYNIAGLISNLRIVTNYEIINEKGESTTMYWRSETVFKNKQDETVNNNFEAEFKIVYKNSAY